LYIEFAREEMENKEREKKGKKWKEMSITNF
jgi:hypothetical protein